MGAKNSNFFKKAIEGSDSIKRNYGSFTFHKEKSDIFYTTALPRLINVIKERTLGLTDIVAGGTSRKSSWQLRKNAKK